MPNGYELLKQQTENVERLCFIDHLRSIIQGEENIEDVLHYYMGLTPPHRLVNHESNTSEESEE